MNSGLWRTEAAAALNPVYPPPPTRLYSTRMDIHSPAYARAFRRYIRRGTPIELNLKMEAEAARNNTHYIWRTVGDGRVRAAHAENEGKIFSWDSPPPTGHPGEDYNCRCTAEPYVQGESEFAYQDNFESQPDYSESWSTLDFLKHSYVSNGGVVTLAQTGHQQGVIDYYLYEVIREGRNSLQRLNAQIVDEARKHPNGDFTYDFKNSYPEFFNYLKAFGGTTVGGAFIGTVQHQNGMMYIDGNIDFYFNDTFTDTASIREKITTGTSDPEASMPWWIAITDGGGTYFPIHGSWRAIFRAEAKLSETESLYKWDDDQR